MVVLVAGDGQSGPVGSPLGQPIRAQVLDAGGTPVWLTTVRFSPEGASGSTSPIVAVTDEHGEATTTWTLGQLVGTHRLRAAALEGPPDATVMLSATGVPGPAARMFRLVGSAQTGFPNETLLSPLLARLADAFGNGVPGVVVRYRILRGGGSLSAPEAVTDAEGLASVLWTLGPTVTGVPDSVAAEVDGVQGSPLYYTAVVLTP